MRRNLGPNKSGTDCGSSTSDLRLGGKWLLRGTDPSKAGKGVAFLTPIKGADVRKAAKAEGLAPAEKIATSKVEGNDKPGLGFRITSAIADSRVNLRGVSGIVAGRKFVAYLGFDGNADADKAARALKALDSAKKSGSTERISSR
jgi:predicted amino acid-binding ACT domain protein